MIQKAKTRYTLVTIVKRAVNYKPIRSMLAIALVLASLCSPIQGAVSISYEADSGGEFVSISEDYDVDDTVTVTEKTDIRFGSISVNQERMVEGTGEANLKQTTSGKSVENKDQDYVATNDINTSGTIDARTATSATGTTRT